MENQVISAVEAQARRADELHRAAYPEKYADKDGGDKKPAEPGKTEPKEPAPAPATQGIVQPSEEDFKQKYQVLQGKYNAEVPRFTAEINRLRAELDAAKKAPPAAAKAEEKPANFDEAIKQLQEEYGEEFVKRIDTLVDARLSAAVTKFTTDGKKDAASAVSAPPPVDTREDDFWKALGEKVPDWAVINTDSEWLTWLGNKDISGQTYQQVLSGKQNNLDADGVVTIFNSFKAAKATKVAKKEEELLKNLQPENGPPGNNTLNDKLYTTAEIKKFYDEVRRGLWDGRAAEMAAKEADIFRAQADGRVTV